MKRLRRLVSLPVPERRLVLEAVLVVPLVRAALWVLPPRSLLRVVTRYAAARTTAERRTPAPRPDRIAWAVRGVSGRVPKASCLTQALSCQVLLARYGYNSQLQIGVGRGDSGEFLAHAWLEVEGRVVIGDIGLDRFARFPALDSTLLSKL